MTLRLQCHFVLLRDGMNLLKRGVIIPNANFSQSICEYMFCTTVLKSHIIFI